MHRLFSHQPLSKDKASELLQYVLKSTNTTQKAIFLTAYAVRGLQWDEWAAFTDVLRQDALPVEFSQQETVWDWITIREQQRHAPSISLAVSLVAAAVGVPIAKFGDYGYGGAVGYSDVLEYMGAALDYNPQRYQTHLNEANFCYVHAPSVYPALGAFSEARKEMGGTTWLDTILPLVHPAPQAQLMLATATIEWVRLYQFWFQQRQQSFSLLHDFSGSAEISLTDNFKFLADDSEETVRLSDWGLPNFAAHDALKGSNSAVSEARRLWRILTEAGTEEETMAVITNAAWWIRHIRKSEQLTGALAEAEAALTSGRALDVLEKLL